MLLQLLGCFFVFLCVCEAKFYEANATDFSKCQVYYSRSGSVYKDFFEITEEPENGTLLDFHFAVMASSDAHILLAPSSKVQKGDPVYEIVIGAGGNTFCDIRRMQKSGVKATVRVKGLLSALDVQSFWIHIGKDGVIDVGKEGEELGFLTWTDPDPLPLRVFSFSTWPGVEAKWFFDCPRNENDTSNSKKLEKPLTPLEKLRKDLLFHYDPYVRPVLNISTITVVKLQLETNYVTLDEHKSTLQYKGTVTIVRISRKYFFLRIPKGTAFTVKCVGSIFHTSAECSKCYFRYSTEVMLWSWNDEKLRWNISNYGDINNLHIFRREIWVPDLYLFNAIKDGGDILEDTMLTVNSTGSVNWMTSVSMNSWCSPDDLGRWPRDEHCCDIVLGFFKDFQNLQLIFNANDSTFDCPYSSKWQILEVESYSNKGWKNSTVRNFNNFDPPGLTLHLKLKRTSNSYTVILFTPFFVIAISLLTTFWLSPFGQFKISLACLQLVLASIVLIVLGILIPIHSQLVPNLVLLYSYSLVAITFCILIEIVVINFSRHEQKCPLPHLLQKILLSAFLKTSLCLPDVKPSDRYGNLNESLTKLTENHQTMWILFGVVIDRIAFFIYLGLAVYSFCITY